MDTMEAIFRLSRRSSLFAKFEELIQGARHIVLASPVPADGDSVGSICAFAISYFGADRASDTRFTLFCAKPIPEYLRVLPWSDRFTTRMPDDADLIIAFDYGDFTSSEKWRGLARCEIPESLLEKAMLLGFDEHERSGFPAKGFAVNDNAAASTTNIVYEYLRFVHMPITDVAAKCLLVGVHADTGGFSNPKTSSRALYLAADLVELGADLHEVRQWLTPKRTLASIPVFMKALDRFMLDSDLGLGVTFTEPNDVQGQEFPHQDVGAIIGWFLAIKDVRAMAHIIFYPNGKTSVSLRVSRNGGYDVGAVAAKLGGGGHPGAAGFKTRLRSMPEIIAMIKAKLQEQIV